MANRLSDTEIWKKDWFLDLTDNQKLLVKFLFDNCDCAGFYKISWNLLKCFFKNPPTKEDFKKIKQVKFIKDDLIFIEDFVLFQYKVESFENLNARNKAHLGVLRLLNKYGVFQSPIVTPLKGLGRGTGIGIGIGIDNNISKQIDTISNINNVKKLDPYINPIKDFFISEYKKEFGNKPYLSNQDCNRLVELASDNSDIRELIPVAIKRLKNIHFDDIQYKPTANWLLKNNNFERVMNGEFEKSKTQAELFRERRQRCENN